MKPITVPGNLDALELISDYIMSAAQVAGLEKKATYNLRLAVDEIATNIIIHGYEEAGKDGMVEIKGILDEQALTIVLEDTGEKYDPTQKPDQDDLDLPLEARQIGGLGVFLAIQSVDKFSYERIGEKNRNTFVVNLT